MIKKRMLMVIVFFSVCGISEMAWANRIGSLSSVMKGVFEPDFVPGNDGWLKEIIRQEFLLEDDSTFNWLSDLNGKVKNGEIDHVEYAKELVKKMEQENGGEFAKRRSKLAIRAAYFSAGIHPSFSKPFIQVTDAEINVGQYSNFHHRIDFSDLDIRPAKPYFMITFDTLDNSSNVAAVSEGVRIIAIKSIKDGYAKFSFADYEAAAITRMSSLSPSGYMKAVESYKNLFDRGFYVSEVDPSYRVKVLSSPYFEISEKTTSFGLVSHLALRVLNDASKGFTNGFEKVSVLKLWEIVRNNNRDQKMNSVFRKLIKKMIRNNTLGKNNLPEGAASLAGDSSFMHSFMEAAREDYGLSRLLNEVYQELNPSR